jgi:hypothetical protein
MEGRLAFGGGDDVELVAFVFEISFFSWLVRLGLAVPLVGVTVALVGRGTPALPPMPPEVPLCIDSE